MHEHSAHTETDRGLTPWYFISVSHVGVTVVSPRVGASRWSPRDTSTYLLTYPPQPGLLTYFGYRRATSSRANAKDSLGIIVHAANPFRCWVHDTLTWKHARLVEQDLVHALRRREFIAVALVRI